MKKAIFEALNYSTFVVSTTILVTGAAYLTVKYYKWLDSKISE